MLRALLIMAAAVLPFGGLYINSLPNGADVWVDGSYIGRTPLLIDGLRAGKHAVTVTKTGWRVEEVDQNVTAGIVTPASVQLQEINPSSAQGALDLQGLSDSATAAVDDAAPQRAGTGMQLRAGTHHLVVRDGDTKFERFVTIYPEVTTHVLFRTPSQERSAVVAPAEAYIPASAAKVSGTRVVVRWAGHVAVGHIGDARFLVDGREVVYDAPAGLVRGRLYLPLDLIISLTGGKPK